MYGDLKEHYRDLASWAHHKGRDNQDKLATWYEMFWRTPSPYLNFAECTIKFRWWNSPVNVILSCIMFDWIYLVFSFVLLKWLVTNIPEGGLSDLPIGESS
jgi:hypothetical protein